MEMLYKIACSLGGIAIFLGAVFLSCMAFGIDFSYQSIGMVYMVYHLYKDVIYLLEKVGRED